MSEENKPITKNPVRVAWGKQLAKMSKELKEKKKKGDNEEIKLIKRDIKIDRQTENKLNLHHIEVMVGIGGLLVAIFALYMQYKNKNNQLLNNNELLTNNNQIPPNNDPYNYYNNF
jgi:hypothetical protein